MPTIKSPLLFVGFLALLTGCSHDPGAPCPLPGPIQKTDCYYLLTITKNDGNDLRGQVAKAVVEQNIAQLDWKTKGYKIEDYQFFEFPIRLAPSVPTSKFQKDKDYWLVGKQGTDYLTEYSPPAKTREKFPTDKYPNIQWPQ